MSICNTLINFIHINKNLFYCFDSYNPDTLNMIPNMNLANK